MQYRNLGRSGLKLSELSYGSWVTFEKQVDLDAAVEAMKTAFDAGVNFFDNAEGYGEGRAEELMGQAFQRLGWRRSDFVVSTKIFWGGDGPNDKGLSRKHILEGTDAALKRLRLDYVDLIFCHRPDTETPIEETVRAMSHLVNTGRALYWGTSEWSAEEIRHAWAIARQEHLVPPTMEQPEYNLLFRQRFEVEYAPLYRDLGLGTTIWSPLSSGILTGKYAQGLQTGRLALPGYEWLRRRWESPERQALIQRVEGLRPLAAELGCSLAQLAIAWTLKNPNVSTTILGASRPAQLTENLAALKVVPQLGAPELARIEAVLQNKPEEPHNWK